MKNTKWGIIVVVSILVLIAAAVAQPTPPPTPFEIYGWVFNATNQPFYGPDVNVTNENTDESYTVKTNANYNYYRVMTSSWDVSAGNVLNFTVNDSGSITWFNYTVEQDDMDNGGLFERNISFAEADLKISDVWVCWPHNCTICYNVTNIGSAKAPAGHNTTLWVDGEIKANDTVPEELGTGASCIRCFDEPWVYTPTKDDIMVCADSNDIIGEGDHEDNNCFNDTWMCGDCNLGQKGTINILDVFAVYNNYTAAQEPVRDDNLWAADCNLGQKGDINILDVFAVYNNYTAAHEPLNCCCQLD